MTTQWVTAAALKAMADFVLRAGDTFTAAQLQTWLGPDVTPEQRVHATSRLCALQFVKHHAVVEKTARAERIDQYTVTPEGEAAIRAAAEGKVRKSGPKASRKGNPPNPQAFSSRLWQLLRIRKMLTARQAAETLCDAGEGDFDTRRATARKCLRRWASAGALEESAKRMGAEGNSNGDKRYVLVKDSPTPPVWHKPKNQPKQGGAA